MKQSQWKNSHDKKQAKGGLRHGLLQNIAHRVRAMRKKLSEEWFCDVFCDVFWGEYSKFIGLYCMEMRIDGRVSKMLQFNVGPLHLAVEKWRSIRV